MRKGGFFSSILILLILLVLGGAAYVFFKDLDGPVVEVAPASGKVSPASSLTVSMSDPAGIRSVVIGVRHNNVLNVFYEKHFDKAEREQTITVPLRNAPLREGSFEMELRATDASLAGFGQGNTRTILMPMRLDTQPPRLSLKTLPPNVRRGGAAVIRYTSDEEVAQTGVLVSGYFVPGYLQKDGSYVCFFPFPYTMTAKEYKNAVEITATDLAGNTTKSRLNLMAFERTFKNDKLDLTDNFLQEAQAKLSQLAPHAKDPLECYLYINKEVRAANVEMLRTLREDTSAAILWKGAFTRLPRSAVRASFADHRFYMYQGKQVGEAYHLGFDMASVRNADIPAANSGRVIFSGDCGIYGNIAVVDHGLGVMSLYSHMSEIQTAAGNVVGKGQVIGKTGSTGMAFGDHLHFGMLVGGVEVTPLEWIDPKWIKDNIVGRIGEDLFPG